MARGWRVIDATALEGSIGGRRGRLTLNAIASETHELPAEEVSVILVGPKVSLSSAALHYATKHDVALLACDWRGVPYAGLFSWGDHTRVAARHLAQSELSEPRRKNAWMQLVKAKVLGQAENLEKVDSATCVKLRGLAKGVRSGDPANVEGHAARLYWSRLFGAESDFKREPRASDPINSCLNYGYMVLRGFGIRAVVSAGLSPPLGLFHRGRSNYFNLVDDLIEPFRPAIDHCVVNLPAGASPADPDVKKRLVEAAQQPFVAEGYRIPACIEDLAQLLGRYVEGDVERLRVTPWTGPQKPVEPEDDDET